jgi:hypothetical protein
LQDCRRNRLQPVAARGQFRAQDQPYRAAQLSRNTAWGACGAANGSAPRRVRPVAAGTGNRRPRNRVRPVLPEQHQSVQSGRAQVVQVTGVCSSCASTASSGASAAMPALPAMPGLWDQVKSPSQLREANRMPHARRADGAHRDLADLRPADSCGSLPLNGTTYGVGQSVGRLLPRLCGRSLPTDT